MTKTYNLTRLNYGWYGYPRKILCYDFVCMFLGHAPEHIKVVVSTEPIKNGIPIGVTKSGYYRWAWRRMDKWCSLNGMTLAAEEELNSIFPDAKTDGLDDEKDLWISLTSRQA